jgi:hypothetical protein
VVCDVEVLYPRPSLALTPSLASGFSTAEVSAGAPPAQVASDDYRINWDRIFGPAGRRARAIALN